MPLSLKKINRIYVLEDHPDTRRYLCSSIEDDPRLELIGEGASIEEAEAFVRSGVEVDAMLVDLGLPDGNGVDFIKSLQKLHKVPQIVVITAFADDKNVFSAIEAGANGYLLKEQQKGDIANSLFGVLNGESPISPSIARLLLSQYQSSKNQPAESKFTPREIEVLELTVKGFTFKEVAEMMCISINTVNSHIQNIYEKLSVNSRSQAVFEAVQLGIIKL